MRCPVCSKTIPNGSRHCAYCGAGTQPGSRYWPLWAVALVALTTLVGGWLVGGLRPEPTPVVVEKIVTQVVEKQALVTPTPGPTQTPRPSAQRATSAPGIGSTWTSPVGGMVLVYVPAGEFTMGSTDDDRDADDDEKPQHKVTLDAFWIDRTEVTKDQYQKCVAAGKCAAPSCSGTGQGNHPVVCVRWQDAADYCAWAGGRLPTEAEWEKAARGTDGRKYPWGNETPDCGLVNFSGCVGNTSAVGSYPSGASLYGTLDMAGNVWEWVADWYNESYYSGSPGRNPTGPTSGQYRVLRGGSWNNVQGDVRAAYRNWFVPGGWNVLDGFRCARSP